MTQHTPGPWEASIKSPVVTHGGWLICVKDKKGVTICEAPNTSQRTATKKANARLIAAAPDLLEALKLASTMLQVGGPEYDDRDALEIINDAIAKATNQPE